MSHGRELQRLAISPTGFVFDPQTGATFTVNPTGRALLEGLRDGLDMEALVTRLGETFTASDTADLRRDVLEYVGLLREHGLLAHDFEVA